MTKITKEALDQMTDANSNWRTIMGNKTRTGAAVWMFTDATRNLHIAHGSTRDYKVISAGAYTADTPYLAIAAYDLPNLTGYAARNALDLTSGNLVAHSGASGVGIAGVQQSATGSTP